MAGRGSPWLTRPELGARLLGGADSCARQINRPGYPLAFAPSLHFRLPLGCIGDKQATAGHEQA